MSEASNDGEFPAAVFARLDSDLERVVEAPETALGQTEFGREGAGGLCVAIVSAARNLPDVTHPFWTRVSTAIRRRLGSAGCDLLVFSTRLLAGSEHASLAAFAARPRSAASTA